MKNKRLPIAELHDFDLDSNLEKPLYLQLADAIRTRILSGRFPAHCHLPPTRSMAGLLALGRNTVNNAYEVLRSEGLLEARQGSGFYVSANLDPIIMPEGKRTLRKEPTPIKSATKIPDLDQRPTPREIRPFTPGIPDLDAFPLDLWARLSAKQWRQASRAMLTYANPTGYQPLREAIAAYLKACRGVSCEPDQVLVVSGSQQGLDLTCRLLLAPYDAVWVENPCYQGFLGTLKQCQAHVIPVDLDGEGLDVRAGRRIHGNPKLVFVTPAHQYPTGTEMTMPRRLELLNFAQKSGSWILEDDYDSEFRYDGPPLAAIQGLAPESRVIYTGTFSKVLFPALRIGYLVVPKKLVAALSELRYLVDNSSPTINQAVLADFIDQGHFASHLRRMRQRYRTRRDQVCEWLKRKQAHHFETGPHSGGMHVTLFAKTHFDDVAFAKAAVNCNLEIRPLSPYYCGKRKKSGLVLGFAGFDEPRIKQALARLDECLNHYFDAPQVSCM